jgi:hypothetical protein
VPWLEGQPHNPPLLRHRPKPANSMLPSRSRCVYHDDIVRFPPEVTPIGEDRTLAIQQPAIPRSFGLNSITLLHKGGFRHYNLQGTVGDELPFQVGTLSYHALEG